MTVQRQFEKDQETFYLELVAIVDTCERIESRIKFQEQAFDPIVARTINSYRKIKTRLLNVLADHGVEPIEFRDQQAEIGLCEIVDVVVDPEQAAGKIIETIKTGYRLNDKILRSAQVVTSKCDS